VCWILHIMLHTTNMKGSCQIHFIVCFQVCSKVYSWLHLIVHCQPAWLYTPNCSQWLPPSTWVTPACELSRCSEVLSEYTPNYTAKYVVKYTPRYALHDATNCAQWPTHSLLDCMPPSILAIGIDSVRNTQGFLMALRALMGHLTHWWRITRCPSAMPWVMLHNYLLFFVFTMLWCIHFIEQQVCYTLHRGCSYAVAIYTTPVDVYAYLQPSAAFHLSTIPIYWMLHFSHIYLAVSCCHLSQCSLRFGHIACSCICFAIIVVYRSKIYCPIFTLSSTLH